MKIIMEHEYDQRIKSCSIVHIEVEIIGRDDDGFRGVIFLKSIGTNSSRDSIYVSGRISQYIACRRYRHLPIS